MKSIVLVALALVAVVAAVPVEEKFIKTLRSEFDQSPEGAYKYLFESEDGIAREETGELKEVLDEENKPHKVIVVRGSYTIPGANGAPETVVYIADEAGYRAEGPSVPKAARR